MSRNISASNGYAFNHIFPCVSASAQYFSKNLIKRNLDLLNPGI